MYSFAIIVNKCTATMNVVNKSNDFLKVPV